MKRTFVLMLLHASMILQAFALQGCATGQGKYRYSSVDYYDCEIETTNLVKNDDSWVAKNLSYENKKHMHVMKCLDAKRRSGTLKVSARLK